MSLLVKVAANDRQHNAPFARIVALLRCAADHPVSRAVRSRRLSLGRSSLLVALVCLIGVIGYGFQIGYPLGSVFTVVPASEDTAAASDGTTAVYVSGDLGFSKGMGPRVARHFAAQGIPTIGVNSLSAFAFGGDVRSAAEIVRTAVARALAVPGTRRVLLIGQSFGANIVLAGAAALPPELKAHVPLVALVVPVDTMQFRATPGGIVGETAQGPALPFARRLTGEPVLCLHGETEEDSLCSQWQQVNVRGIALPGDHYLQHDDALVAATLLHAYNTPALPAALPKVQARPNSPQRPFA